MIFANRDDGAGGVVFESGGRCGPSGFPGMAWGSRLVMSMAIEMWISTSRWSGGIDCS